MPKLKEKEVDVKNKMFRAIVRKNLELRGMEHLSDLALKMGVSRNTIYKKVKNPSTLTLEETRFIFKELKFSEEEKQAVI